MTDDTKGSVAAKPRRKDAKPADFDVSKGLKQLYNSVLDEPLPSSFQDLLAKLDEGGR